EPLAASTVSPVVIGRAALAIAGRADREDELLGVRKFGHAFGTEGRFTLAFLPGRGPEIGVAFLGRGIEAAENREGDNFVVTHHAGAADAGGGPALEFANVGGGQADRLAVAR